MPQLYQLLLVYQSQWFWLLLTLAIIYFGVAKGMVPKIEKVVEDRDAKIADDLAAAESARKDAEATHDDAKRAEAEAHELARTIAADAKARSAVDAEKRLAEVDAAIADKLAAAEASIAQARAKALESLEAVAAEVAMDMVGKVAGMNVPPERASAVVKGVLSNG